MIKKEIKSWADVSLNDFNAIKGMKEYDKIIAYFYGQEIYDMPISKFNLILAQFKFMEITPAKKPLKFYDGYDLIMNVANMNVAQYIDYTNTAPDDMLGQIAMLVVPKGKKYGSYDFDKHKKTIGDLVSVEDAVGINYFSNSLRDIKQQFTDIFATKSDSEDDVEQASETDEVDDIEVKTVSKESSNQTVVWLSLIESVIDYTKLNILSVYRLPIIEFFTYLSYVNYKNIRANAEYKAAMAKIKRK